MANLHVYAADVNQLAAQSEDMDNGDSEKAKRGKKKTSTVLHFSPSQNCSEVLVELSHEYLYFLTHALFLMCALFVGRRKSQKIRKGQ